VAKKKSNKGNANRAARRAQPPKPQINPETLSKFGDALKKAGQAFAEKKKREQEGQTNPGAVESKGPRLGGALTKPDAQRVLVDRIEWVWDIGRGPADEGCEARVKAIFHKGTEGWMIQTGFPEGTGADLENFDAPTAQKFAEAILSAVVWENNWRDFAGDYLSDVDHEDHIHTKVETVNIYNGPGQDPRGVIMDEANRIAVVPPSKVVEDVGIWCPGGGKEPIGSINVRDEQNRVSCGHCNRWVKLGVSGKFFPHKWEVK
jgi:hypothetical protein